MNLSLFESVITLNLESLSIPHITIKMATTILKYDIPEDIVDMYKSIPGATPKDIMSDKESTFFPKSNSSSLFVFLATQPSNASNITAINMNLAASTKLPVVTITIDKNPEDAFARETISAMDV